MHVAEEVYVGETAVAGHGSVLTQEVLKIKTILDKITKISSLNPV